MNDRNDRNGDGQGNKSSEGRGDRRRYEDASEKASAARDTARDALSMASERIDAVVSERKTAAAERVERFAGAAHDAADRFEEEAPAVGDVVHMGAEYLEDLARAVRERGVGELSDEVRRFARRHPAAVAGTAALLGFAAVRVLTSGSPRGERDEEDYGDEDYGDQDDRDQGDGDLGENDQDEKAGTDADAGGESGRDRVPSSAFEDRSKSSGDPGGKTPVAPGFEPSEKKDEAQSKAKDAASGKSGDSEKTSDKAGTGQGNAAKAEESKGSKDQNSGKSSDAKSSDEKSGKAS
ncbi:hypothetical protein [Jannaschia formosa]|uniref:hypothetical protein n=1 Tax=Jannaschia formosa TaxID=2259592 RepID=UPI000E1B8BB2|nr:hypothetical protein [Jannaschia formosa]TFL15966.1 hypothetical protein DR046_22575 [Jannaschia formosa]